MSSMDCKVESHILAAASAGGGGDANQSDAAVQIGSVE